MDNPSYDILELLLEDADHVEHTPKKRKQDLGFNNAEEYHVPNMPYATICGVQSGAYHITVERVDKNTIFSPEENAYITYRQNQFKLRLALVGLSAQNTHIVQLADNSLCPSEGLYFNVYAVKESLKSTWPEERVEIIRADRHTPKKDVLPIPAEKVPSTGLLELSNLQFQTATPKDCYTRIVSTLLVKVPNGMCALCAIISPRLIIRSKHPGHYDKDAIQTTSGHNYLGVVQTSLFQNPPANTEPITLDESSQTHTILHGKLGINTNQPAEALTVVGNVLVLGGDIYRPSDKRIKSNFRKLATQEHAENIAKLQLYEYDVPISTNSGIVLQKERGVIAQETQEVLPHAVQEVGNTTIGDKEINNLLVLNERTLLYENIGATQYANEKLKSLENVIVAEKSRTNVFLEYCDKLFRLPKELVLACLPPWILLVFGFLFGPLWAFGVCFVFARLLASRIGGLCNVVIFISIFVVWPFLGSQGPSNETPETPNEQPPPCMFSSSAGAWGPVCSAVPFVCGGGMFVLLIELCLMAKKRSQTKENNYHQLHEIAHETSVQ